LTAERLPEGKMRVTSSSWDAERVLASDQVLEVRWVDGRLHVARKDRHPDEWDRPVEPHDRYGPPREQSSRTRNLYRERRQERLDGQGQPTPITKTKRTAAEGHVIRGTAALAALIISFKFVAMCVSSTPQLVSVEDGSVDHSTDFFID